MNMAGEESFLILGGQGMLGRAWDALLTQRGIPAQVVDQPELNLTDFRCLEELLSSRHRVVVNCAAWTDVDGAETAEPEAVQVNGQAVGLLAERCRAIGARLVHYSTDYVFKGLSTTPYPVGAPLEPVNAYGRSKARGETLVQEVGGDWCVIRTSWLYAPWGKNFVRTIAQLARHKEELSVVADQRGRPTQAQHLARTSLALIEAGGQGIFHVTDGGECSWYDLAAFIVSSLKLPCRVVPCGTEAYPRPAPRPGYSVLDISGTETFLGQTMPPWPDHVAEVLAQAGTPSE
jgi:dTDP-4-dehydrorhamnose reductase